MKRWLAPLALAACLSLLAGCVVQSKPPGSGSSTTVTVTTGPNNYIGGVSGGPTCGSSSTPCTLTLTQGQTLTFMDDKSTGSPHIMVIGTNGTAKQEAGAPDFGSPGISLQPGQSKSTPPWTTVGTYDVSCTIHPTTMNLKVTVTAGASGGTMVTTGPNNYIGGVGGGSACGSSSTPCTITIKKGQTITFLDDKSTGTMHILVIGPNGAAKREPGAPDFGSPGISLQPGQSKSTPPWNTPGTYDVSCTIHPTTMNLRVTVTA